MVLDFEPARSYPIEGMLSVRLLKLVAAFFLTFTLAFLLACGSGQDSSGAGAENRATQETSVGAIEEPAQKPTGDTIEGATQQPVREPAQETTVAATEEPTREPAQETTVGATEEPTREPAQETIVGATEEPTREPAQETIEEPTKQAIGKTRDTGHVEYMVRLMALAEVGEFWFVDLASIASDPELAPLYQNLLDTWDGWNKEGSSEFGLGLKDASFAVSLPGRAVILGGIEELEAIRATMAEAGYQQNESTGVTYWYDSSKPWPAITFLPYESVLITSHDPAEFLADTGYFITNRIPWNDSDWQSYLDYYKNVTNRSEANFELGSADKVVSDIRESLVFYVNLFDVEASMIVKAGDKSIKQIQASYLETEADEAEYQEAIAKLEKDREELLANMPCTDIELSRDGKRSTVALTCLPEFIDLRYANYFMSIRY